MPSEEQIQAAAAAIEASWRVNGDVPFPFYPRELRVLALAALEAADQVRAPKSFACVDGVALRALHRVRALEAIAAQRCATDLTDGFCGPRNGQCVRYDGPHHRSCAQQAHYILQAIESRGCVVVWEFDPTLKITMEKV